MVCLFSFSGRFSVRWCLVGVLGSLHKCLWATSPNPFRFSCFLLLKICKHFQQTETRQLLFLVFLEEEHTKRTAPPKNSKWRTKINANISTCPRNKWGTWGESPPSLQKQQKNSKPKTLLLCRSVLKSLIFPSNPAHLVFVFGARVIFVTFIFSWFAVVHRQPSLHKSIFVKCLFSTLFPSHFLFFALELALFWWDLVYEFQRNTSSQEEHIWDLYLFLSFCFVVFVAYLLMIDVENQLLLDFNSWTVVVFLCVFGLRLPTIFVVSASFLIYVWKKTHTFLSMIRFACENGKRIFILVRLWLMICHYPSPGIKGTNSNLKNLWFLSWHVGSWCTTYLVRPTCFHCSAERGTSYIRPSIDQDPPKELCCDDRAVSGDRGVVGLLFAHLFFFAIFIFGFLAYRALKFASWGLWIVNQSIPRVSIYDLPAFSSKAQTNIDKRGPF